jgi:hypothetical protein
MHAWTIMLYMAGDNGAMLQGPVGAEQLFASLEAPGWETIQELQKIGSTDQVGIVVQFDTLSRGAFRVPVTKTDNPTEGLTPIGQVNTGEPGSLSDFVAWAAATCPAERNLLVVWGHGTGWKEDPIYARYEKARQAETDRDAAPRESFLSRGVFASTLAEIMAIEDETERGIAYDDSSRDFLDNTELQVALHAANQALGPDRRLDVLGLDACLMSMMEVAYQVRREAGYLVASEAVTAAGPWPWRPILGKLNRRPDMSPDALGKLIVVEYARAYGPEGQYENFTQALTNLSRLDAVIPALDTWVRQVLAAYDDDYDVEQAMTRAAENCLRFEDEDFADLYDFVDQFAQEYVGGSNAGLQKATETLLKLLRPGNKRSPVVAKAAWDYETLGYEDRAHGLAVYLPKLDPAREQSLSQYYARLDFARTAWPALVCKLNGVPLPEGFTTNDQ